MMNSQEKRKGETTMKNSDIPYGYKMDNERLITDKVQAAKVKKVFDDYITQPLTKENEETMQGTIIYTRSGQNAIAGESLASQLADCEKFAVENGMTVVDTNNSNRSIHKLIEDAIANDCEGMVIFKKKTNEKETNK